MDRYYKESSGLLCCFCNDDIIVTDVNPCDINILLNWDKQPNIKKRDQTFWCHLECFRSKLHNEVKIHLIVDLLSTDDN